MAAWAWTKWPDKEFIASGIDFINHAFIVEEGEMGFSPVCCGRISVIPEDYFPGPTHGFLSNATPA
jgi:hypothetical protein